VMNTFSIGFTKRAFETKQGFERIKSD